MTEWVWTHSNFLSGKGFVINSTSLFSATMIDSLKFSFDGKFSSEAEITELVKDIIETDLESWKPKKRFLPVSVFELILRALWAIKIRSISSIRLNDKILENVEHFLELCQRVHDGDYFKI